MITAPTQLEIQHLAGCREAKAAAASGTSSTARDPGREPTAFFTLLIPLTDLNSHLVWSKISAQS